MDKLHIAITELDNIFYISILGLGDLICFTVAT